jgi:hypothetical protein
MGGNQLRLRNAECHAPVSVDRLRRSHDKEVDPMKALLLSICVFVVAIHAMASESPPVPATPAAVSDLVYARPFTLAEGYEYNWSADRPIVRSGTLVVLRVDPDLVLPRNSAEPVLYAGNQPVQRLNRGYESGHVIAIIPGEIDLTQTPIWFGRPGLPERINTQTVESERALADAADIRPFAAERLQSVSQESLQAADLFSLLRDHVANLVLEYSPQERDLAETWRLPVATAGPRPR